MKRVFAKAAAAVAAARFLEKTATLSAEQKRLLYERSTRKKIDASVTIPTRSVPVEKGIGEMRVTDMGIGDAFVPHKVLTPVSKGFGAFPDKTGFHHSLGDSLHSVWGRIRPLFTGTGSARTQYPLSPWHKPLW